MAFLYGNTGPITDSTGGDLVLLDEAGRVILTAGGDLIVIGGSGQPLTDGSTDPAIPSTTDVPGMARRLRTVLPSGWFPDLGESPVIETLLQGFGAVWADIYTRVQYAHAQARIATATDGWLDMAGRDFTRLTRRRGEPDASFSARIRAEIVRPRATRAAIVQVLTDLTGHAPSIFEPSRPADTGGYNIGGIGYGVGGGYGSRDLPSQVFVTAYRGSGGGVPGVVGYYAGTGWAGGGYGVGAIEYASPSMAQGQITDAELYAAVASVMPAGGIAWTAIT